MKPASLRFAATGLAASCAMLLSTTALGADRLAGRDLDAGGKALDSLRLDSPVTIQGASLQRPSTLDPSLRDASASKFAGADPWLVPLPWPP